MSGYLLEILSCMYFIVIDISLISYWSIFFLTFEKKIYVHSINICDNDTGLLVIYIFGK